MPLSRINNNAIANNTIVSADLSALSVTGDKIGLTAINANNVVDASITSAKLAAGAGGQFLDNQAVHVLYYNGQNLTSNITVSANQNAFTAGPFTINDPYSVTLNAGSTWVIL
jgi:hypothetical protein